MSPLPSLFGIKTDIEHKDYLAAREKCTQAIDSMQERAVERVPYLLGRAEALRSLGEHELALQDARMALSSDPSNPKCNLCLGQIYQSIAAKEFGNGITKCSNGKEGLFISGNLKSAQTYLSSKPLVHFDPLVFLPREVLGRIFTSLPAVTKIKCLKVCKGWKQEFETEREIWRHFETTIEKFSFNETELFSIKSNYTLRSVCLDSTKVDRVQFDRCLTALKRSAETLNSLSFQGSLTDVAASLKLFTLTRACSNLKEFSCNIIEENLASDESYDRYYINNDSDSEDDREEDEKDLFKLFQKFFKKGTIDLDRLKLKSPPSTIVYESSPIKSILVGAGHFFSNAKTIELNFDRSILTKGILSQDNIATILRVSCHSLQALEISQKFFSAPVSEAQALIRMPKLQFLKITIRRPEAHRGKITESIQIDAPHLKPEHFVVNIENLIVLDTKQD